MLQAGYFLLCQLSWRVIIKAAVMAQEEWIGKEHGYKACCDRCWCWWCWCWRGGFIALVTFSCVNYSITLLCSYYVKRVSVCMFEEGEIAAFYLPFIFIRKCCYSSIMTDGICRGASSDISTNKWRYFRLSTARGCSSASRWCLTGWQAKQRRNSSMQFPHSADVAWRCICHCLYKHNNKVLPVQSIAPSCCSIS